MSLAAGTRCGPYEVVALLGAGGMGEVYRARDTRLGREVALKVLPESLASDAERLTRFEREARAASSLNHPNVLAIYDIGAYEGAPFIVSELLDGRTLRDRLKEGPIPVKDAVRYGSHIADGLAAAHERGIVHRDLKPENIFICTDDRVKILDFGLAKLTEPKDFAASGALTADLSLESPTREGAILGTVGYMAPEQVRGKPADARADIFALGSILYEMCSGRGPFRTDSGFETMHAILTAEPPEFDAEVQVVPPELDRIIRHCLEKEPVRRFQSVEDLRFSLQALFGRSLTTGPLAASKGRVRRRLLFIFVLIGVAAVALALASLAVVRMHVAEGKSSSTDTAPPVTFRRLTFRAGNISAAEFAPDGRTIVYAAQFEGEPVQVFGTRLDGPESRRLHLPPAGLLSISSNSTLALALDCRLNWGFCQGTLARVPLSGGAPRQILEDVDYADWNPKEERLAVVHRAEGRYRIEYPIGHALFSTEGWITGLRFSPDGTQLTFCEHPTLGSVAGNLSVVDLKGTRRILSKGWIQIWIPRWTPDGRAVLVSGSWPAETGPGRYGIWATDLEGNVRPVLYTHDADYLAAVAPDGRLLLRAATPESRMVVFTSGSESERIASWFDWSTAAGLSADGQLLLFYEWGEATGHIPTVYVRPTDGGDAIRLGRGKALALSPDQQWALAVRGSPQRLVVLPLGPGEERELDHSGVRDIHTAHWFPDGRRILFTAEGEDGVYRTYYQNVEGGPPEAAPIVGVLAELVSPDGGRIAGYGLDGERYICDTAGEDCASLKGMKNGDEFLQWSADGNAIYVRGANDEAIDIFQLQLRNGERKLWKSIEPRDTVGMLGYQNEGIEITPDGHSYAYTYWRGPVTLYLVEGVQLAESEAQP